MIIKFRGLLNLSISKTLQPTKSVNNSILALHKRMSTINGDAMELPDGRKITISDVVNLYREQVKTPIPSRADISNDGPDASLKLRVVWSSRDCYQLESSDLVRYYNVKSDITNVNNVEDVSDPTDVSNIVAFSKSLKSNKIAQIRSKKDQTTGKDKQIIEILGDNFKTKSWDVEWFEAHGPIIMKSPFGSFSWSNDEKALVYVAEFKQPKAESYFKFKKPTTQVNLNDNDSNKSEAGQENIFYEDWGEALDSVVHPVVCVLNIETDEVKVIELKDHSLGQPFFIGESYDKIGLVAWSEEPRRLGIIYCPIRPSLLYSYDLSTSKFSLLAGSETNPVAIRSPRVANDGKKLVYLENSVLGPHFKASKVMLIENLSSSSIESRELIGLNIIDIADLKAIYVETLPDACWSQDNSTIIFSCMTFNIRKILAVNILSGKLTNLQFPITAGATVLSLKHDLLAVSTSSLNRSPAIFLSKINTKSIGNPTWIPVGRGLEEDTSLTYTINKIPSEPDGYPVYTFLIGPTGAKTSPCVVLPHGGPHMGFVDSYMSTCVMLAKLGFKSLLINYRGSAGFDEEYINSLPGFVGDLDVKDCVSAINYHVQNDEIKQDELVLWGGSHGGFLVTHLSGQCSSQYNFKSCICRNPVTDLVGMMEATDIPDWIWTEGLKPGDSTYDYVRPTLSSEDTTRLLKMSPIFHLDKVKVPTLMMLGKKDRRVPMSQGMKYYKGLKARGVSTKCLVFDDKHDLYRVDVDSDSFVNIIVWILKHWK